MSTVKELLSKGIMLLEQNNIEDSIIKARRLIQYVLKKTANQIIFDLDSCIKKDNETQYLEYINQIINGKPLQYITHEQEFMGFKFYVDENVLIPQPDTETLVERAIEIVKDAQPITENINVLDMCTGSGAIAVSIAKLCKNIKICALDISDEALEIAKKNAFENEANVEFFKSDMFENISKNAKFDLIVSNPPYIKEAVISTLSKDVQNEPHIALSGGIDGLDFYRIIANNAYKYLKYQGKVLVEIGYDQEESVENLFEQTHQYDKIRCIKDLSGNDRVIEISI